MQNPRKRYSTTQGMRIANSRKRNGTTEHRKIMERMKILEEIRKQKQRAMQELSNQPLNLFRNHRFFSKKSKFLWPEKRASLH